MRARRFATLISVLIVIAAILGAAALSRTQQLSTHLAWMATPSASAIAPTSGSTRTMVPTFTPAPSATPTLAPAASPTDANTPIGLPVVHSSQPNATVTPSYATEPLSRLDMPLLYGRPSATPKPTKKPTRPSPTPTLSWPAMLEHPSASKLGIHVQWNNSPEIMAFIRHMKPAVVMAIDDLGFLTEVKRDSPATVTVARFSLDSQPMEGDPVQAAGAFVARHLERYRLNPGVDYWVGYNEPGIADKMAWYAAFEAERARLMAEHGLRVAVGNFSAGVPELDDFAEFLPAIEATMAYDGILALHEYDAPTLDRSIGAGLPGQPNYPDRGALALRYRWWYKEYLEPRGMVVPLVITEAGVDGMIGNRPGPEKARGWIDFVGYWAEQGLGQDGITAYLAQLEIYDLALRQDEYVLGCAVFTAGPMGDRWRSYDITPILRHIATFIIAPATR